MDVDFVVPGPGPCSAGDLHSYLRPAADPEVALIDLTGSTWCEPGGLVGLTAFAEARRRAGRNVRLVCSRGGDLVDQLSGMGLADVLEELGVEHNVPRRRGRQPGVGLSRVGGERDAEQLAAQSYDMFSSDPLLARALHVTIAEIGLNAWEHSGLAHGYVAVERLPRGNGVVVAVGDAGRGVRASLRVVAPRLRPKTDVESLELVLDRGVTCTGERGRGEGILETRRLVTGCNGTIAMVSGVAARFCSKGVSGHMSGDLPFSGTVVRAVMTSSL